MLNSNFNPFQSAISILQSAINRDFATFVLFVENVELILGLKIFALQIKFYAE
jgi:hypothetical protein